SDQAEDRDQEESEPDQDLRGQEDLSEERPDVIGEVVQRVQDHEGRQSQHAQQQALARVPSYEGAASRRERDDRERSHVREDDQEALLVEKRLGPQRLLLTWRSFVFEV